MFITKINLDRNSPYVRSALSDRQQMHSALQRMFMTDRKTSDVLFRLAGSSVYVSSNTAPVEAPAGFEISYGKEVDMAEEGSVHRFSLVAIPRKVVDSKKRILRTEEERINWLVKKGHENGFAVCFVREDGREPIASRRKGFDVDAYKYSGTLRVTDSDLFAKVRLSGLGSMKAYGCGFLMIV